MSTTPRVLAALAVLAIPFALAACSSEGDAPDAHEHASHQDGAMPHDDHAMHGAGGAMEMDQAPQGAKTLEPITPSADYPLRTCVVSGEELGGMGDVAAYRYDGTEVQFCCAGCVEEFEKSPDEFVAKVRSAAGR